MSAPITIRPARPEDIPHITAIYAHAVEHGTASFEIEPPSEPEMAARRTALVEGGFPYLVADAGGRIDGYAYAGPYRPRIAYRYTVEDSVYVHPRAYRNGIGRMLLTALIARARETGQHSMIAAIESGNATSIRLHERRGFEHVGTLKEAGTKFGRWFDLTLMQLRLAPPAA